MERNPLVNHGYRIYGMNFKYTGSSHDYKGSVCLFDRFGKRFVHSLKLAYDTGNEYIVNESDFYPHPECGETISKCSDCAHMRMMQRNFGQIIPELALREKDEFSSMTGIFMRGEKGSFILSALSFTYAGGNGEWEEIIGPSNTVDFRVRLNGNKYNPKNYFIDSISSKDVNREGIEVPVFHHGDMIKEVRNIMGIGDHPHGTSGKDMMLDPLFDLTSVLVLDETTSFCKGGEAFDERCREALEDKNNNGNDVINRMMDCCSALRKKKEMLSHPPTRPC